MQKATVVVSINQAYGLIVCGVCVTMCVYVSYVTYI